MLDHDCFRNLMADAAFDAASAVKRDLFQTERLFVGLNYLRQGQAQRVHVHQHADKFYLVMSGKARITVGTVTREVGPAGLVWAPAGVPHGIAEAVEDAIVLVSMSPPPTGRS